MRSLTTLVLAAMLAACSTLQPKAPAPSQFLLPISNRLLTVKIPARNAEAVLVLVAVNQGVETWQTADDVSVSMRNGVVVGTRGLGFDVIGSDVQGTLNALAGRQSGAYQLVRSYLSGDNRTERVTASCTLAGPGADGKRVETCRGPDGAYRNEYWLDGAGRVAGSNQWIGPQVQYLNTSYSVAK